MKRKRLAVLVIAACLIGLVGGLAFFAFPSRPKWNLLLITLDTTRADRLGCYGYADALTPTLDALATEGVLFERAYAPAPLTLPAHASLFTGLYPPEHSLRTNGRGRLSNQVPTLAEILSGHGFESAGFVASFVLDSKFGLDRGFAVYGDDLAGAEPTQDSLHRQRDGRLVVDEALAWLERPRTEPFFCWVHLYDPHFPYQEHEAEFGDRFRGRPYDAEIAYVDLQIQRLVDHLKSRRLEENTLVVIVGDHGEGLGEHVELTHGYTLYNATQHVPLIFWNSGQVADGTRSVPATLAGGTRVAMPVSLVDVLPTMLECLAIAPPAAISGRSVYPALKGDVIEPVDCYAATDDPLLQNGWSPLRSLTTERWRYIRTTRPELYDLHADPRETRNLAGVEIERMRTMDGLLLEMEERMVPRAAASVQLSPRERQILKSLGYAGGGSGDVPLEADQPLPDVKDMLPFDVATQQALDLLSQGELDEAIARLRQVVAEAPAHVASRVFLGEALEQSGKLDEAISYYRQALEIKPDFADAHTHLGNAYIAQGKPREAAAQFATALEFEPESADLHFNLGLVHSKLGDLQTAMRHHQQALQIDPAFPGVHLALGNLWAHQGRTDEALKHFGRELDINPNSAEAHVNLGAVLFGRNRLEEAEEHLRRAVEIDPEIAQAQFNLGMLLMRQGRRREAVKPLTEAARLLPDEPRVRAQLDKARRGKDEGGRMKDE